MPVWAASFMINIACSNPAEKSFYADQQSFFNILIRIRIAPVLSQFTIRFMFSSVHTGQMQEKVYYIIIKIILFSYSDFPVDNAPVIFSEKNQKKFSKKLPSGPEVRINWWKRSWQSIPGKENNEDKRGGTNHG